MTDFQKTTTPVNAQKADDFANLNAPSMKLEQTVKSFLEPCLGQHTEVLTDKYQISGKLKEIFGNPDSPTVVIETENKETFLVNFNHVQSLRMNVSETIITDRRGAPEFSKPTEKYIPVKQPDWD